MKVIPKHQKGGSFDAFFTTYVPIKTEASGQTSNSRGSSRTSQSDSEKGKLTEKDFFDMMKDIDGLPNEMNNIVSNLMNTFQLSNLTGIDPGNLATTYLQNLYQIKIAAQNKKRYDEVISNASKNGSLAEPAISMDGKLIVQNRDGSIGTVSLDTFNANKEEYSDRLLTVSNLANMRKYDPQLVNNQSVFEVIDNSMGYEAFQELLSKATQSIGTSELTRNGMFSVEGKASKGLQLLQSLREDDRVRAIGSVTAEGLYEYKIIDKDQLKQINALTSYITATLPDRAKTWAAIKTEQSDKNKATKDLVLTYLLGRSQDSHSFNVQYKGGMDKVQGKTSTKTSEDVTMTYLTALQNGYGGRKETRTLNFGNNTNFNVTGTAYGAFLDQDKKTLSNPTLSDLLSKTGVAMISNPESITFGDNILNPNSLSRVVIENNGGFWAVLPCKRYGNKVVPDFQLMASFNKVVQEVLDESGDSDSPEQKQKLLESKLSSNPELQELLTMSGNLDSSKVQPFFIVDGLASENNFTFKNSDGTTISDNSNPLIQVTNDQDDIKYFQEVSKDSNFDTYDNVLGDIFGLYDKLYKSKVFIPIQTNNRLAAIIFSGQEIKDSNARAIEGEYQRYENQNKMNIPSSKYLYE